MKIFSAILAVTLTAFLAAALAQGPQNENLKVIYNLSGNLQTLENKELVITFSDDMVPLGGKRDGNAIIKITPASKGEFFWRGNRSLAFKPELRFRYSTTYTAIIPAGTSSLTGKTLAQALQWQWSTPLAIPIEIKTAGRDYFLRLAANEKLDYEIWVKDAITLRFNQPVTAASAKDFIVLKETKSKEPASIRMFQKGADQIEIRYDKDLKRGTEYQFTVKKGFCGSEGNTGTIKDFSFTFATVPSFRYTGVRPLITFPDSAYCRLLFSNPLAEFNRDNIKIFKISGQEKKPLAFNFDPRDNYDPDSLLLEIAEELFSGDTLNILVDRSLTNVYKEQLPEKLALEARVCSSRSPRIAVAMQGEKLSLTLKSMKKATVRLLKFKPDFYSHLQKLDFGILQKKNFKNEFIEKEIFQNLENLPEKENSFALPNNEPGSSLGFFGVLVNRFEPYNACKDISLMRLPLALPPDLQVFHRRNMDMVIKASHEQTLYWLYDNRSGKGLGQKPFFVKPYGSETLAIGESTADGVLLSNRGISASDLIVAKNADAGDIALARIDYNPEVGREIRITVFSDRDFYRPGDTVHINGIVKEYTAGEISSSQLKTALLKISGPDRQQVKTDTLRLDDWGGFHYEFKSDPAGKKGRYQIQVKVEDAQSWRVLHNITIDYYQPNTIEVAVSNMAEHYLFADTFHPVISGSYLAGNPMAGDAFTYMLYAYNNDAPKIFKTNGLDRYSFGLVDDLANKVPHKQSGDKLDARGKFTLDIPMETFKATNYLAELHFSVTGKSAEGKEFTAQAKSLFFPGNLLTGIHIDRYQNLKEQVKAELALVDFQGKPASGEIRVYLYQQFYEDNQWKLKKVAGPDDLYIEKNKVHSFRVQEAGVYVLRCDTPDANGRIVSTSGVFIAWDSNYTDHDKRLRVESDQWTVHTGETLKCFIHSPRSGQALVTVEREKVLDSRVIALQKMTPLEIPIKKEYFPSIRVNVIAMYGNNVSEEVSRDFTVTDEGKTLRVDLESPGEIKPASQAKLKIKVSNEQEKGVKAKLFVYAVDEGNLSLQGYQTPDPLRNFYYSSPFRKNQIRTYYSKNYSHWTFKNPMLDIELTEPAIFGCVFRPDATPIAGAIVILEDENHKKIKSTSTSTHGYYSFSGISDGNYAIKAEAKDFHSFLQSDIYFDGTNHTPSDLVLIPAELPLKNWSNAIGSEGGVEGGIEGDMEMAAPVMPMAAEAKSMARMKGAGEAEDRVIGGGILGGVPVDIAGIRVRSDFREVLFFKTVETDESGNATIDFESSDQLSTFRIMAVAYNEDSFGKAEKEIMVSKDLLISEAMPEFARQNDEFRAGVQLSNRTAQKLAVTLLAKPEGIRINGNPQSERSLDPRSNSLCQFPFLADRVGAAKIEFYALSAADKDGLEKKFLVSDCLTTETLLDFASGKSMLKKIEPQVEGENQTVTIKVAPSMLKPAVTIARKLVFYPYECLEQRSSKVMPFLALSPQLAERLELGLDPAQVRAAVDGYLKIIPEFMNSAGALSYYRGGQYTSDYLTAYVLWSLYLAKGRDYQVDPQLLQKLTAYLQQANLDKTTASFYQFVLSLGKNADNKKLEKMVAERETLSLPARVFLYRALNNQQSGSKLLPTMLAEFNNSLQIEADFAYFDVREFSYDRDFPFYSSRFATAILLQAILEVEHEYFLAEKIINWLLEGEPYCWNTTQTNFWILCAMDEYLQQVEKSTARKAEIIMLGEKTAREFLNSRDMLQVSKKLAGRKDMVEVKVNADQPVYVTSELTYQLANAPKKSRGIDIRRLVYDEKGQLVESYKRGQVYQVELLLKADKEIPYGVIDEPLAAGFELLRQDVATTRTLSEFNSKNSAVYHSPWLRRENAVDRLVFYTYSMQGSLRIIYFIKAIYSGRFTWLPTIAQGMYHPQYFGRCATRTIVIDE